MVETQKETATQITKKIEDIPLALPAPMPNLPRYDDDPLAIEQALRTNLDPRATHYLQLSMTPKADLNTFGLRVEDGSIMIGSLSVIFDGDDFLVDDERYKGTPGDFRSKSVAVRPDLQIRESPGETGRLNISGTPAYESLWS